MTKWEWAQWYARKGWRVIPLHTTINGKCSCGKDPCPSAGKHPRCEHGIDDATTDKDAIDKAWSLHPDSNIGIVTGKESDLTVLDIDPRHGGEDTIAALPRINSWEVHTQSGGRHIFMHYDPNVPTSAGTIGPGLDVRSDRGYVVAAGSTGGKNDWTWDTDANPKKMELGHCPEWMRARKNGTDKTPQAPPQLSSDGKMHPIGANSYNFINNGAAPGKQRHTATGIARNLLVAGFSIEAATAAIWQGLCKSEQDSANPWTHEQAEAIVIDVHNSPPHEIKPKEQAPRSGTPQTEPPSWTDIDGSAICDVEITDPPWLVSDMIAKAGVNSLNGRAGHYKSFLALEMARAVAYGDDYAGELAVEQGIVAYFDGDAGLKSMKHRWAEVMHCRNENVRFVFKQYMTKGRKLDIAQDDHADALIRYCDENNVSVLVLDPIRAWWSGSENNSDEVAHLRYLFENLNERGITVLYLHHFGKGDTYRGSTEFEAIPHMCWDVVKREGERIEVSCSKAKECQEPETRFYQFVNGRILPSDGPQAQWMLDPDSSEVDVWVWLKKQGEWVPTPDIKKECCLGKAARTVERILGRLHDCGAIVLEPARPGLTARWRCNADFTWPFDR